MKFYATAAAFCAALLLGFSGAQAATKLQVGQLSAPIRTKVGLHVLAICGKRAAGAAQVDHDQIENRLTGQQLSMVSRRYMRDLRNSATIETR